MAELAPNKMALHCLQPLAWVLTVHDQAASGAETGTYRTSSNICSHGLELEGLHEGVQGILATPGG